MPQVDRLPETESLTKIGDIDSNKNEVNFEDTVSSEEENGGRRALRGSRLTLKSIFSTISRHVFQNDLRIKTEKLYSIILALISVVFMVLYTFIYQLIEEDVNSGTILTTRGFIQIIFMGVLVNCTKSNFGPSKVSESSETR